MSTEAMKLALDDLIAEYHMENSSFAKRVDDIFKEVSAQRKPLTDEEIEKVWRSVQANDFHDCVKPFARAIEAKHNIKGEA